MPWGLTRSRESGQSHFVTFCGYHRPVRLVRCAQSLRAGSVCLPPTKADESSSQPWSGCGAVSGLQVYGYVVMPEHVHLLLSEPQQDTSRNGTAPLKPRDGLNGPPSILTRHVGNRFAWSRFVSNSIHNTELQVRCRGSENDVLVAFDQRHPSVLVSVRPTDSLEFDIDLEVRTISADERTLQSR